MTLSEMLTNIRRTLDDETGTDSELLWQEDEITDYLNEAVERLCRKVPSIIKDNTTHADVGGTHVCSLSLVAGTISYALHPSIMDVVRVKLSGSGYILEKRTTNWLDERTTDWDNTTNQALPRYYTLDYTSGYITFCYTPDQAYTASLTVHRLPLDEEKLVYTNPDDIPAIPAYLHRDLIYWALHKCYSKNDAETFNDKSAELYGTKFEDSLNRIYNEEFKKRGSINIYPAYGML